VRGNRVVSAITAALLISLLLQVQSQESNPNHAEFTVRLVAAANERPQHKVRYDPAYVHLAYPGGDVPADTGVCTDEIIRIYRKVGIDLQKEVHEDMVANFGAYPKKWAWGVPGIRRPNADIDHRRVPNLMVFFARKGESLPLSKNATDYLPGDIVAWDLGGGVTHIGIVVDHFFGFLEKRYGIVHNIGAGPKFEDALFSWKIIGHYRYYGPAASSLSRNQP
jgi:uncharacterized protein YijF (DUF1287 family)